MRGKVIGDSIVNFRRYVKFFVCRIEFFCLYFQHIDRTRRGTSPTNYDVWKLGSLMLVLLTAHEQIALKPHYFKPYN